MLHHRCVADVSAVSFSNPLFLPVEFNAAHYLTGCVPSLERESWVGMLYFTTEVKLYKIPSVISFGNFFKR